MTNTKKDKNLKNETAVSNEVLEAANLNPHTIEMFEEMDDLDLIDLSSNLLKLEEGEVWNGIVTREVEQLEETKDDGEVKTYDAQVIYHREQGKQLIADAVALSTFKRMFEKHTNLDAFPARIIMKGMKTGQNGKNTYRDLRILSNIN